MSSLVRCPRESGGFSLHCSLVAHIVRWLLICTCAPLRAFPALHFVCRAFLLAVPSALPHGMSVVPPYLSLPHTLRVPSYVPCAFPVRSCSGFLKCSLCFPLRLACVPQAVPRGFPRASPHDVSVGSLLLTPCIFCGFPQGVYPPLQRGFPLSFPRAFNVLFLSISHTSRHMFVGFPRVYG